MVKIQLDLNEDTNRTLRRFMADHPPFKNKEETINFLVQHATFRCPGCQTMQLHAEASIITTKGQHQWTCYDCQKQKTKTR